MNNKNMEKIIVVMCILILIIFTTWTVLIARHPVVILVGSLVNGFYVYLLYTMFHKRNKRRK